MKTKLFAMYLPQFHEIPENSIFWGKGFTDWVSVKNSTPLFKNHIQPKVPYQNHYYDLSEYEDRPAFPSAGVPAHPVPRKARPSVPSVPAPGRTD